MKRNRGNRNKGAAHNRFRHGMSRTGTYSTWSCMKSRCLNPNNSDFAHWGGRGITVCDQWLVFENFLRDMGEKPAGKTLERLDVNKGYSPENCVWADRTTQSRNRTYNKLTLSKAADIRAKRLKGADYRSLASEFGVSEYQIGRVIRGEAWAI